MSLSSLVPRPTGVAPTPGAGVLGYTEWLLRREEEEALQTAIALSLEHNASFFPAPDLASDESVFPSLQAATASRGSNNTQHFRRSK